MSRYLLLFLLNLPFVLAAIVSALTQYKLGKSSKRRFWVTSLFWLIILGGLASAGYVYEWLFSNNLTETEPLSLFDVIQITGIVILLYATNRSRMKLEMLEKRLHNLHQELSITLSTNDPATKRKN